MTFKGFDQNMHMVGHDAPSQEAIALGIEVQQGVLNGLSNMGIAQVAGTVAGVLELFDAFAEFDLIGVGGRKAELIAKFEFFPPTGDQVDGDGIGKAKGDELKLARAIKMGEIAA